MSFSGKNRLLAAVLALLIFTAVFLSPMLDPAGTHNHGCALNDCLICLVANMLGGIRNLIDICLFALITFIALHAVCEAICGESIARPSRTPIALKTKILS